ncbi:hypothetical protein M9435_001021 [Picochlorum sp. BPE23]|nr:hypothetical protein M9435_001021 [Picochlorum sp. BPE23]
MAALVGDDDGEKNQGNGHDDESMCCTTRTNLSRQHEEYFDNVLSQGRLEEAMEAFDMAFFSHFDRIVSMYQEQPQLLDPILEGFVGRLASIMMDRVSSMKYDADDMLKVVYVSKFLWKLASVRGYKTILRFMPCEVYCVEPVFHLSQVVTEGAWKSSKDNSCEEVAEVSTWECEYVCLMWSSQLALVPFKFDIIDSSMNVGQAYEIAPLAQTLIDVCKDQLKSASATRNMAAVCLGRLLTRPDMTKALMDFATWCRDVLRDVSENSSSDARDRYRVLSFLLPGIILTWSTLFKIGRVQDEGIHALATEFIPHGMRVFESEGAKSNPLLRKLCIKMTQRAVLLCVTDGKHAWLADEGTRDTVEMSIDALITALDDQDTIVRWSGAKGVGRVSSKLPSSFVNQVIDWILEQMHSVLATENSWHGGCLALAELTRRDLIPRSKVSEIIPVVEKGLEFEIRRGYTSVGANVRDAAAYVCWALARTQSKEEMRGAVLKLAPILMTTACYDREVNCRRAAAAAFQESVGRLGEFPHGIDILTIADYFTVSLRKAAYIDVAPQVAAFPGYHVYFARHLLEKKLRHWEKSVRELAAQALASLVHIDVDYHCIESVPRLIQSCPSTVLDERHGAVAALACVIPQIYRIKNRKDWIDGRVQKQLADIIPTLVNAGLTKGVGGETMRGALCRLIASLSQTQIQMNDDQIICLYDMCRENLSHPSEDIQLEASVALSSFLDRHIPRDCLDEDRVLNDLIQKIRPDLHFGARRGSAMVFGKFPPRLIKQYQSDILNALIPTVHLEEQIAVRDVETRVNAIRSLPHVLSVMDTSDALAWLGNVFDALLAALDDYSTDNRGDIGSWCRDAAVRAATHIFENHPPKYYDPSTLDKARHIAYKTARVSIERISKVRQTAGSCLKQSAERYGDELQLQRIYDTIKSTKDADFQEGKAVAQVVQAISPSHSQLSKEIVSGLVYSIGGLDAALQELTASSLVNFVNNCDEETAVYCGEIILDLWETNLKNTRLSVPSILTVDHLLSNSPLMYHDDIIVRTVSLIQNATTGTGDVGKLCSAAALLGTIVGNDTGGGATPDAPAIRVLVSLIGKRYPKVRKMAAEQLYTAMLMWDEETASASGILFDNAQTILMDTAWDGPAAVVRPARERLAASFGFSLQ